MNIESTSVCKEKADSVRLLSFDDIPNQSKLFLDYQYGRGTAQKYYPSGEKAIREVAADVLANYKVDRNKLCDALRTDYEDKPENQYVRVNIERLRNKNCVAVIAGQQAGLFSGPLFTIYKALSAIKLARELTEQGIEAVPMFWIASEDHDLAEANRVSFPNAVTEIETVSVDVTRAVENNAVGAVELGSGVDIAIDEYFENIVSSEFSKETREVLERFYNSGGTFSSSFASYILHLFSKFGLILICPMGATLRELVSPIFVEAIEKSCEITEKLLARDADLAENGYHSQVFVSDDFFPFFYFDEAGQRNALRFDSKSKQIHSLHGHLAFSKEELIEIARKNPERLSPNVLMRSVVQDYLFPTVCYFGGSAEIAYFAQNEVIYRALDRPFTQFRHRASFTIVDPKSARNLRRYRLTLEDFFASDEELSGEVIDKFIASDTANTFNEVERTISEELDTLEEKLIKSDKTLANNLLNRKKKILWHLQTLKTKFHRAEVFKNDTLRNRLHYTRTMLYPRSGLQERTLNIVYFLNLYGENFIDWLYDATDSDAKDHQFFYL
ncbi:MAG: bacillithiol biosynthesis cysteine-adding enzyme BshC [Pyrinomonadaceae bacterium]